MGPTVKGHCGGSLLNSRDSVSAMQDAENVQMMQQHAWINFTHGHFLSNKQYSLTHFPAPMPTNIRQLGVYHQNTYHPHLINRMIFTQLCRHWQTNNHVLLWCNVKRHVRLTKYQKVECIKVKVLRANKKTQCNLIMKQRHPNICQNEWSN